MKKLTSVAAIALVVTTAACQQMPPQAPQGPPPPPAGWGPPPGAQAHEGHEGGPMGGPGRREARGGERRGEHGRPMGRGPRGDGPQRGPRGPQGEQEVMHELAMLGVHFYPPPMLIKRAAAIGLTPDQIAKIRQEVLSAQARSVDLKAKIEKAKIESIRLLAADKVDERAVAAQIDEGTKAAAELRKLQVGVMLHVRDLLTPDQLKKLEAPRERRPDARPGAGPGRQAMGDADDDDDDADDDDDDDDEG